MHLIFIQLSATMANSHSGAARYPAISIFIFITILVGQPMRSLAYILPPVADAGNNNNKFHERYLKTEVDSIVVVKHFRHMYVFNNKKLLKVYSISLGEQPVGAKHFKGDRKTPEGIYYITKRNANSMAHKSLAISYPNDKDRQYAKSQHRDTGGDVMIHGILNGEEANTADWMKSDWTWGCIAVTNQDVDELYEHVQIGSPINILP